MLLSLTAKSIFLLRNIIYIATAYCCVYEIINIPEIELTDEIIAFWGPGYQPSMYAALEQRRSYWMSRLPKDIDIDIGTEALIRQICSLELDINRDRAAGRAVDKSINALNTLLGSASLKPTQKKTDGADAELEKMPLGVGLMKWEYYRPLPATPEDQKDVHGIIKNITTWFYGHLCKMVGLRGASCRLYEDAMQKLRVNRPEYTEEDDDFVLNDILGDATNPTESNDSVVDIRGEQT